MALDSAFMERLYEKLCEKLHIEDDLQEVNAELHYTGGATGWLASRGILRGKLDNALSEIEMMSAHILDAEELAQLRQAAWDDVMESRYGIITKQKVMEVVPSLLDGAENIRDMDHFRELALDMDFNGEIDGSAALSEFFVVDDVAHGIVSGKYDLRNGVSLVEDRCRISAMQDQINDLEKRIKELEGRA